MLSHFSNLKKKAIFIVALSSLFIMVAYCLVTFCLGIPILSIWMIAPLFLIPIFGNLIFNKFESKAMLNVIDMVHLYENDCKPRSFVDAMDPILNTFKPHFDINEVWLLAAYARALVEISEEDKARLILDSFEDQVSSSEHPEEKGPMMVNYEPLFLMIKGPAAALILLDNAEKAINDIPTIRKESGKINRLTTPELREDLLSSPDMKARLLYIQVERKFLQASIDNDTKTLEYECNVICSDDGASKVLKSRYIYALAMAYLKLGETAKAKTMLKKTISVARGLKCAEEAKRILLEL